MIRVRVDIVWLALAACSPSVPPLTPAEAAPPLEQHAPARASELDTRAGFGALTDAEGDGAIRALAMRFLSALADENTSQLNALLQKATWQPGASRLPPASELARRFAMHEFQALRTPIARGEFDSMQVRVVDSNGWDVRLPLVTLVEPLFAGRPVLRIVRNGEQLAIASYGED